MSKIVVIDYGVNNLSSVRRALIAAGADPIITDSAKETLKAEKLVLPGIGAFKAGMDSLREKKLIEPIIERVGNGVPILGICLGMQLLMDSSEEFGLHQGLGLIPGEVKLLHPKDTYKFKIPHIGWNSLLRGKIDWKGSILEDIKNGEAAYFVHSYGVYPTRKEDWLAETEYGGEIFCSVVSHGNIEATQFHPEKSGEVGQRILKSFIDKL